METSIDYFRTKSQQIQKKYEEYIELKSQIACDELFTLLYDYLDAYTKGGVNYGVFYDDEYDVYTDEDIEQMQHEFAMKITRGEITNDLQNLYKDWTDEDIKAYYKRYSSIENKNKDNNERGLIQLLKYGSQDMCLVR